MSKRVWDTHGRKTTRTQCSSCGYETECVEVERELQHGRDVGPPHQLCEVCYSTHLASPALYPGQYGPEHATVCSGIAWGINRILDEIRLLDPGSLTSALKADAKRLEKALHPDSNGRPE